MTSHQIPPTHRVMCVNPQKETTMKKLILTAVCAIIGTAAMADTFPGAAVSGCDPEKFVAIYSDDGETILYWNNPTCPAVGSGSSILDVAEE